MNKIFSLLFILLSTMTQAQQLNCTVKVNYDKITNANAQIFRTLETALKDFVNKTDWTGEIYEQNERINCSMVMIINSYDSNQFSATLQVQSSRPIYNSTYSSPVLNFNDKDFNFKYVEFENLLFNPANFDSNLVSVISFYSFMIIGLDADTFSKNGGTPYYDIANEIVNVAQQGGYKGWRQADGNQNRFFLINDILSPTFAPFRETLYQYHMEGLDIMNKDLKSSKDKIKTSIKNLSKLYSVRPNAFLTRVFFDAKSDEIVSLFSGGPGIPVSDLVDTLNKLSPINSSKWTNIKL
jgi:hypothetical protein